MAAVEPAEPSWLVLRVRSPSEEAGAWLSEGLIACGASAVQEDGGTLVTWFPAPADPEAFIARVSAELQARNDGGPVVLDREWRADEDWLATWRRGLAPRRIGRIIVSPTWCEVDTAEARTVITIDPQMAFGTGEHASTRGVLRLLQDTLRPGDRVLDIGTGSGVLAIAAARLGAGAVTAVDLDADALDIARENVTRNGVADAVRLDVAQVDGAWLTARTAAFDLVLANVLSGALLPLLPALRASLAPDGRAILSGILVVEAVPFRTAATRAGFRITAEDAEQDWWSVSLSRAEGEEPGPP